MPPLRVELCLRQFQDRITRCLDLNQSAGEWHRQILHSYRRIHNRDVEAIAGLSLLRMFLAWETFLEDTFCRYLCGGRTSRGFAPTLIGLPEPNMLSAMTKLVGSRRYLSWNKAETENRARIYFLNGEPYTTAGTAVGGTIEEIVTVRNRFAHRSDYSRARFQQVVIAKIGYFPQGYSPGRFLRAADPNSAGGLSMLESYATALGIAANIIVP